MKKLFLILFLMPILQAQAFWFFNTTKTKTIDEQRHSYDENALSIDHAVNGEKAQAPNVSVTGTNNNVDVNVSGNPNFRAETKANTKSNANLETSFDSESFYKSKLPWSIAALLFVLAFFLFFVAINYAKRTTPAMAAIASIADTEFSALAEKLKSHIAASNDPAEKSTLSQWLSEVTHHRQKVSAQSPAIKV